MVDLSVRIGSVELANPVMPGSGTFAEGLADVFDLNRLGAIVTKTFTPDLREGTPPPRVVEFKDATLFAIGIPSKGPRYFLDVTVPFYRRFTPPLIASISADTVEDFAELARAIDVPDIAAVEANISCPNLRANGLAFAMDLAATRDVIQAMKASTSRPVWAKLTPNVGDIAAFARTAEAAGADALVVANAFVGMAIDVASMKPRLGNVMGGLTGPAIKPLVLRMVFQCAQAVSIPVIGCGGATGWRDVVEYMLAGATAVQIGTATFIKPTAMLDAIAGLSQYCVEHGIERIADLTGAVRLAGEHYQQPRAIT